MAQTLFNWGNCWIFSVIYMQPYGASQTPNATSRNRYKAKYQGNYATFKKNGSTRRNPGNLQGFMDDMLYSSYIKN